MFIEQRSFILPYLVMFRLMVCYWAICYRRAETEGGGGGGGGSAIPLFPIHHYFYVHAVCICLLFLHVIHLFHISCIFPSGVQNKRPNTRVQVTWKISIYSTVKQIKCVISKLILQQGK